MKKLAGAASPRFPVSPFPGGLGVRFGFAEAGDAVAILPLTPFFQDGDSFKAFENVAFAASVAGCSETAML